MGLFIIGGPVWPAISGTEGRAEVFGSSGGTSTAEARPVSTVTGPFARIPCKLPVPKDPVLVPAQRWD